MTDTDLADLTGFLDAQRTAALATVDEDGQPAVCNVQVVRLDRLNLVWASSPGSAHSLAVERTGVAALALYGHADVDPAGIHGVQLRGEVERVELEEVWSTYARRFPVAASMRPAFDAGRQAFYRFRPTWIRWIDNRRGFGFKVEADLPQNGTGAS